MKQVLGLVGIKVTKDSFAKTVTKTVPLVGGVISGGMTLVSLRLQSERLHLHLRELPPPGMDAAAHRVLVEAAYVAGGVGRATELRDAAKGAAASSVAGVKDALPTMPEQPVMTLQTGRGASQLQRLLVPGGRAR